MLPLARITLEHHTKTPTPHLTPLQAFDLSAAICLDIASPTLLNTYLTPPLSPISPHNPSLILNPSFSPHPTLAEPQFEQMISRAIEQRAWILRCDAPSGISGLVSPSGEVRVLKRGEEGGGSWQVDIDLERGSERTMFSRLGEGVVLNVLALVVLLVAFGGVASNNILVAGRGTLRRLRRREQLEAAEDAERGSCRTRSRTPSPPNRDRRDLLVEPPLVDVD
jgi:apolipoprotein N-acyltransferase